MSMQVTSMQTMAWLSRDLPACMGLSHTILDTRSHLSRLPLRQCGAQDGPGAVSAEVTDRDEEHPATKRVNVNWDNIP